MADGASGKKKKGGDDKSLKGRLSGCGSKCFVAMKKIYVAIFNPSIHSFFFWSFLMYFICGLTVVVGRDGAQQFFCNVRPQFEYGGMGCANASSNLLMCAASSCWRNAVNITYKVNASTASGKLYEAFKEASTDVACNAVVTSSSATDPISMIVELSKAMTTAGSTVTSSCATYHCGVLENALARFGDLNSDDGVCTNTHGSKVSAETDTCVCASLMQYEFFDPFELTGKIPTPTSTPMMAIDTVCGDGLLKTMQGMCSWSSVYPVWCGGTTVTTTTETVTTSTATETTTSTATSSTATETTVTTTPTTAPPANASNTSSAPSTTARRLQLRSGYAPDDDQEVGTQIGSAWDLVEASEALPSPSPVEKRQLQTDASAAPTPGVANDDLEDYETGDWSRCTCYQQCTSGVRTRVVECLADSCKSPKPPAKATCMCDHAAQCIIDLRLIILLSIYFLQALFAFIVFACYLRTLSQTEDDFIKLGILKKMSGFFYKQLPPLIRILVLLQLFQVIYLSIDVWIGYLANKYAESAYQKDCFASNDLRIMSQITAGLWVVGVIMGKCTKQYTRRPDWLYSPERPGRGFPMKQFRQCFRCLGP